MDIGDPKAAYERLRAETAEMLRLNADSASLIEGLQVDLVALLRLEIDTLQGAVLAGDSVDLGRLALALTMLRSLLPEKALVSAPPPAEVRFSGEHQKRLREMIQKVVLAPDDPADEALRSWRDEQQAILAAGGDIAAAAPPDWKPAPVGGASLVEARDNRAESARQSRTAEPAPPVPPPPAQTSKIPAHYLKQDEPWREFVSSEGIVAPYFKPYG